jgi:ubiquinone/menaquinone biosynthesis C-methylase UbiE
MSEWDIYWSKENKPENKIYDAIAIRYRKYIINPYLTKYLNSYFKEGSILLHAGCGSGQVENTDMNSKFNIIGIDNSQNALHLYGHNHNTQTLICGTVLSLGIKNSSVDGVYSLGLIEHFTLTDIRTMLLEFNRIVKPNGIVLVFAPPEYGLTVKFFKFVDYILNTVLQKDIWFQPYPKSSPEINRIQSKEWMEELIKGTGFTIQEFNFELKDLYTHVAVVLKKIN